MHRILRRISTPQSAGGWLALFVWLAWEAIDAWGRVDFLLTKIPGLRAVFNYSNALQWTLLLVGLGWILFVAARSPDRKIRLLPGQLDELLSLRSFAISDLHNRGVSSENDVRQLTQDIEEWESRVVSALKQSRALKAISSGFALLVLITRTFQDGMRSTMWYETLLRKKPTDS